MIVASYGVESASQSVKKFKDDILKQPRRQLGAISIRVKKIYEPDVLNINADIIRNSRIGLAFQDDERVTIPNTR